MNFADELRHYNEKSERETIKEYGWTNCLPTVEYYRKSADEFNRGKKYDDGGKFSTNSGSYETRLYGNLILFSQDRLFHVNMLNFKIHWQSYIFISFMVIIM